MNILIINNSKYLGLGDFINYAFILFFYIKLNFNHNLYFYEVCKNKRYIKFYKEYFSDIFTYIDDYKTIAVDNIIVCVGNKNIKNLNFVNLNNVYCYNFGKVYKYYNYINCCNKEYLSIDGNIFPKIHNYMYKKFYNKNYFCIKKNTITISIGSVSKRNKDITDKVFQDIITDLIIENKLINFCVIGFEKDILSDKFKNMMNSNPNNLLNLINKDKGLKDVINILYHSKVFLTRCNGLKHLAGLLNIEIISLKSYRRGFESFNFLKDDLIEYDINDYNKHPFFYEQWCPISKKYTRIVEFKKFNFLYNSYFFYNLLNKTIKKKINLKEILIITNSCIGDLILSTGVINNILTKNKNVSLNIIKDKRSKDILNDTPKINKIYEYSKKKYHLHWINLLYNIFFYEYDEIYDFKNSLGNFLKSKKKFILKNNNNLHILDHIKQNFKLSFYPKPFLYLNYKKSKDYVRKFSCKKYVVLCASLIDKDIDASIYIKIINYFYSLDIKCLLIGSNLENNFYNKYKELIKDYVINYIHTNNRKVSVLESAYLINHSKFYIGRDSGFYHIAQACNIPSLIFFRKKNILRYGPINKNINIIDIDEYYDYNFILSNLKSVLKVT